MARPHPSALLVAVLAFAVLGVGSWWLLRDPPNESPTAPSSQPSPTSTATSAGALKAASGIVPAGAPIKSPIDVQAMVRYPDGNYMPALNGVRGAPAIQWPPGRPFSPVVGKMGSPPNEWYVHADGCLSTTMMTFRSDINRESPVSHVAEPQKPLPVSNEDDKGSKK